ncbi:MAG: CrcB family protein [Pseudomonadota bacterium]
MGIFLSIAAGGAIGALSRYGLNILFSGFYTIVFVNILGSFLMGIAFAYFNALEVFNEQLRLFIVVGILSSFTTFSTFSLHIFQYLEQQAYMQFMAYLSISVIGSIMALIIGFWFTKQVLL